MSACPAVVGCPENESERTSLSRSSRSGDPNANRVRFRQPECGVFIAFLRLKEKYVNPSQSQTNTTRKPVFHFQIAQNREACCKFTTSHVATNSQAVPDVANTQRIDPKSSVLTNRRASVALRNRRSPNHAGSGAADAGLRHRRWAQIGSNACDNTSNQRRKSTHLTRSRTRSRRNRLTTPSRSQSQT